VSRKTVRLTVDHLAEMAEPARSCLFWELSPVDRTRLEAFEHATEKETWVSGVLRDWGSCGRVLQIDGRTVGHILYAPAAWLPGAAALPTAPTAPDAIVLATAWVDPDLRRGGLGRVLVQAMAADLVQRGHSAIEAYGDTRGRRMRAAGGVPRERGLQDPARTPHHAADADGAALDDRLEGRGGGGAGADLGRRTAHAEGDPPDRIGAGRPRRLVRDQIRPSSSLRSAAFGLAPTMDLTTSPPW